MHLEELAGKVEDVSAIYARNHGIERDTTWFLLKLREEVGELTQAFLMKTGQARDKGQTSAEMEDGFRFEVADVLCQVLLLARQHGIDLEAAWRTSGWCGIRRSNTDGRSAPAPDDRGAAARAVEVE